MEQKTLQLIEIPRIPSARPYRHRVIRHKRKQRDKAAGGLITIATASLILNIALSVLVYILQAGPIR